VHANVTVDFNEGRDDWVAVASAEPYANYLNLTPERKPRQFLQARYPSCRPTNNVKALKAML